MASNQGNFNMSDLTNVLVDEDRIGLVNAIKNLVARHPDVLESLTPKVRKRVDFLREIQSQHDELEKKFFEERAALEAKYQKLYQPLYTKRYEVVNGIVEVDPVPNEPTTKEDKEAEEEEKGVPEFWLLAMKNNDALAEEITERDEEALKYLKDIKWCRVEEPKGFKLEFFFDPNPYFKNTVLMKTYHMIDEDEPILEKAVGTEIEWNSGKCLTQKILKKPKKGLKVAKQITKTGECESFFNFFSPPKVPGEDEDIDEDAAEELQNQMEQDYDVGSTIRDKVIPHAVSWFTGEAIQGNEFDDDDDDDDDEDIDYDDDDDDEEDVDEDEKDEDEKDEDEEDGGKTKKKSSADKKSGSVLAGEGQQGERPSECKQQ